MSRKKHPALAVDLRDVVALDASAGTGKTYSIALIHLRLVLAGIPVEKILVTTFTEAAAAELRERLRRQLAEARDALKAGPGDGSGGSNLDGLIADAVAGGGGDDTPARRIDVALACFDLAPICTIHGFCHRLLRDNGLELGVAAEGELAAEDPRIGRLIGDFQARIMNAAGGDGDGTVKTDVRQLSEVARTIREYAVPPEAFELSAAELAEQWRKNAAGIMRSVGSLWAGARGMIEESIRSLVEAGKLAEAVFDNPKATGDVRWRKLRTSLEDMDALLTGPVDDVPAFSSGVKRLFLENILDAATERGRDEVRAFVDRMPFFRQLESVRLLPAQKLETEARAENNGLFRAVGGLKPGSSMIFADLINAVYRNLGNVNFVTGVRKRFDAVLVDECQDTDARQLDIFRRLFAVREWLNDGGARQRCIVWVGDPKQSIYRFRGADIDTYIATKQTAGKERQCTLDNNFRSDEPLVNAVNNLFLGPEGSGDTFHSEIRFVPAGAANKARIRADGGRLIPPAFCLHTWATEDEVPVKTGIIRPVLQDCAGAIRDLLRSGVEIEADGEWRRIKASDIAVLAHTGRDLESLRHNLTELGIASAYRTDSSVFLEAEARDMSLLLKAMAVPGPASLKAALVTPFFGYTLAEVAALKEKGREPELDLCQRRLAVLAERLRSEGFMSVLFSVLRDDAPGRGTSLIRLAARPDGERILTNIIQTGELLQQAWINDHARSAEALKDYLDQAITRAGAGEESDAPEEAKLRLETDTPAVILSTIHASKGLQYPVVFLPAVWAQRLARTPACIVVNAPEGPALVLPGDPGSAWHDAVKREENKLKEEQMRLLYVALTRAKHQVHVWWGRMRGSSGWYASSTQTAFGQLLMRNPAPAESYTDEACCRAFEAAMRRGEGAPATFEISGAGEVPEWCRPGKVRRRDGAPVRTGLAAAEWTRGRLPSEPLQSSYSALLRRNPETYRGADEMEHVLESVVDGEPGGGAEEPVIDDLLAPFSAGAVLGDRVHKALEIAMNVQDAKQAEASFAAALAPGLPGLISREFQAAGGRKPDCSGIAGRLWRRLAAARISGKCCFADFLESQYAPEWKFMLPQSNALTPVALGEAVERSGAGSVWARPEYVERLKKLDFRPLTGFFDGIVDLLGCLPDGNRWVILDYKTNRLDGYGSRDLDAAMAESHYLLQALLYTVAVRRWLMKAVAGWSYESHFEGVSYVFLRGLKEGSGQGVWSARPPEVLVKAVDDLFCGAKEIE